MSKQAVLSIKNLKASFYPNKGQTVIKAVDDVSLDAYPGEITAIVGQSGSGKSVTALCVFNIVDTSGRIEAGEVFLNGRDLRKLGDRALRNVHGKEISMIFQDPTSALNPSIRIKKQLIEAITAHERISKNMAMKRCEDVLVRVGLKNTKKILNSYPFELSGGMCQRVMIAMAIISNPNVLIADEPTTALDLTVQRGILEELLALRDKGMAVVLITHDLGVVAQTADQVYVMNNGKIVENGTVYDIFEKPQHKYTKELMNAIT